MYAQTNYPVPQGIPPTRYTIAEVGCFITSFCNILERFGTPIDPPALNNFLRDNGIYIDVDDGVRDDVAWNTITRYDPSVTVAKVGNGRPDSNNSIVKFVYNSGKSTHFCLVNNINDGTIIDSWDGKVKSWNAYGGPVAYAVYNKVGDNMEQRIKDLEASEQRLAQEVVNRDKVIVEKDGRIRALEASEQRLAQDVVARDKRIAQLEKGVTKEAVLAYLANNLK